MPDQQEAAWEASLLVDGIRCWWASHGRNIRPCPRACDDCRQYGPEWAARREQMKAGSIGWISPNA